MSVTQADIGLIGLAVMGENLVLNMANNGFSVAVFNRTVSKVDDFVQTRAAGKAILGAHTLQELVASLKRPRRVMTMVKAGPAVDQLIEQLIPLLEPGDIIIDGGNSWFEDTQRRQKQVESRGLLYIGTGVSGGEEGALRGPSIMPGGSPAAWPHVKPILQAIAAKVNGEPCCDWVGSDGAGHFVKMVHNGIEYGDMQLICEAYDLLKRGLGMTAQELHDIFSIWNKGELDSYLIEITAKVFTRTDSETGRPLVDVILDAAGQKGTGKWTSSIALDLGVPVTLITESVFARIMAAHKEERVAASKKLRGPKSAYRGDRAKFIESIRQALFVAKICSYAQGFALLKSASDKYGWKLNLGQLAMLWRGGCIIRAAFLTQIRDAFSRRKAPANLLLDPNFKKIVVRGQGSLRRVIQQAAKLGIPVPCFGAALAYFDSYRSEVLPANLLQAQRDFFGAHTYERVDKPRGQFFHTEWMD
ncbi:MAG: decarboxylating NADP(+)-dependent phosphogluconate dehydrogenase [Kiritimatiellae bacterium]|nr:decarboxylating NADP(+)-dependent phosphogluconate dehydrogenase [Kiritimatiellia bacterium]MCO5061618.1 decarboxylating NADP(+)-dependent phosphogluconate dehydrogenase [Kiritimatiellia bacterium]MCO6400481.1 decarboxylating NADP(+)-dependent phosphogluconate dehydrogenase [Verrucomicrobiota bacterium]